MQTLRNLDLRGNYIGAQGAEYLANVLETNKVKEFFFLFIT